MDIIPKKVNTFHFNHYQMFCLTAFKLFSFAAPFLWQTSLICFESPLLDTVELLVMLWYLRSNETITLVECRFLHVTGTITSKNMKMFVQHIC